MRPDTSLDYYDRILVAIGASLGGGALTGIITTLRFRIGLVSGSLLATIFVYHAMFRNPPNPAPSPRAKASALVWHVFLAILLLPEFL